MSTPSNTEAKERDPRQHILTVVVEDYFHSTALNPLVPTHQWKRLESRVETNTRRALKLLAEHNIEATFFVLGWVADEMPEIVHEIVAAGHEVASRGYYHRALPQFTKAEFREEVVRSKEALERASGKRVIGHRVSQGNLGLDDLWMLDILAEEGFLYDSSMYPRLRSIASQPWRRFPHVHRRGQFEIREFPYSSWGSDKFLVPMAGGNYFRQLPTTLTRKAFAQWDRVYPWPFNMYFLVWELDPDLPRIATANVLTRIRQYRNIGRQAELLKYYFERYQFGSIASCIDANSQVEALSVRDNGEPVSIRTGETASAPHPTNPAYEPDDTAADEDKLDITVITPCYNEELIIPYLANTLEEVRTELSKKYRPHFLFVDDASTDGTWQSLAQHFGNRRDCDLVRHERNQGVAGAILTGVKHARTEIVCSIDCDCTYDPNQLAMLIPLLKDDVDLVTASPYHTLGGVRGVPAWRLFLSRGLSGIYRRTLNHKLATYTSCFRIYRRSVVENMQLREKGFLGVAEMLALLDLSGRKIVECPAVLEVRMFGQSKMKTLSTIIGHLKLLGKIAFQRQHFVDRGRLVAGRENNRGVASN